MTLTALVRLARHELTLYTSVLRWLLRRPPHGVDAARGDSVVSYATGQWFIVSLFFFVSVVETVALAFLIPWPLVHRIVLGVDLWGILFIVGLHVSCLVRPHVIGGDGALRILPQALGGLGGTPIGALVDIRVPAGGVAAVRLERRFPGSGVLLVGEDGTDTVDLPVGGETNLTIELTEPVAFARPLGRTARARVLRCYADEPGLALAVLKCGAVP